LKDGIRESEPKNLGIENVTQIKAMNNFLLLLNKKGIHFYKFGQSDKMESCRVMSEIIDFTFDNSNQAFIYALTTKKEVVMFELSQ
jgi:hypothetical protein